MTSEADTAIAHLRAAVDECLAVDLELVDRDGLLELARQVEVQRRRLPVLDHRLVAVLESRGVAVECGATSTAVLLRHLLRISPGEARARVAAAADLGPRRGLTGEHLPPLFEHVAAAQAAGVVSVEQAKIITGLIDTLPDHIHAESGETVEAQLTGFAADLDPIHLGQVAHRVRDYLDPDGTLADDRYKNKHREVTLSTRRDGTHYLTGELDDATHVVWQTILDTLSTPTPGPDGEPDPRHAAQRRHDALREAGHRLLQAGSLPDSGGTPTTVLLTINADHLTHWLTNQDADRLHELAVDLIQADPAETDLTETETVPAGVELAGIGAVRNGLDGTGSGWAGLTNWRGLFPATRTRRGRCGSTADPECWTGCVLPHSPGPTARSAAPTPRTDTGRDTVRVRVMGRGSRSPPTATRSVSRLRCALPLKPTSSPWSAPTAAVCWPTDAPDASPPPANASR